MFIRVLFLTCSVLSFVLGWLFHGPTFGAEPSQPNILIITADNLGYGDLPCFNDSSKVIAPNFERLADQGARLTEFYTASPTCTVSRACLLTGRVAQRHGLTYQLPGIEGNYGPGLNASEILIPQVLKQAGYATGCFGKWNIGFAPGARPTERGFDEFLGHASGNIDYYTHNYNQKHDLFRGIKPVHLSGYSTDLFADAAIDFIRRQSDLKRPWFTYLPFNAPHFPNPKNKAAGEPTIWQAPAEAFRAYEFGPATENPRHRYWAVVTALDSAIGRVLRVLDELAVAENTFVFFFSDNGAFMLERRGLEVASNAPLRDGGVTCWEGGIRVAAIARWPKKIRPGITVNQPLWSPDLFQACARLSGAEIPPKVTFDGMNPLPALTRSNHTLVPRSFFFRYRNHSALRLGDWKIVRENDARDWQLFNLGNDVGEREDLSQTNVERLNQLVAEFHRWDEDVKK